jgi:hypothetical protein
MQPGPVLIENPPGTAQPGPANISPIAAHAGTNAPRYPKTFHAQTLPPRTAVRPARSGSPSPSPALQTRNVTAKELQTAGFFVLGLYASVAVLNLHSELSRIGQHWHGLVEFLARLML